MIEYCFNSEILGMLLLTGTKNGERATGNGQRATGNGQRATRNGQRATGNGQRATGNGEPESGNECTAVTRLRNQNGGQEKRNTDESFYRP